MVRKEKEKLLAVQMRQSGDSILTIAQALGVSKSSVSVWTRHIELTADMLRDRRCVTKEQREILKKKYEEDPKLCKKCNNPLDYDKKGNKFCNTKCAGTFNAKRKERKPCLNCDNSTKRTFCCTKCSVEYNWKIKTKRAKELGRTTANQTSSKKLLLRMRGHKCEICNITDWMGQSVPLVLDHINGKCKDWRLNNLRLVCGNCDMQLPTYKSKNKNSQRKGRKGKW